MGILNDKYPAYTIEDTLELAGMHVNAFRTPHDCAESFGYRIEAEDGHTVTVATDIGHITPEVEEKSARHRPRGHRIEPRYRYAAHGAVPVQLKAAHFIGLRASLKYRVRDLLPELFEDGTKHFLLAHLSRENNTPDIARQTAVCGMQMAGVENAEDYILQVAPIENLTGGAITF